MKTFRHSGKLGDIVYSLPTVKALGGGIFYVDSQTQYPEKPPLGRAASLMMAELLETQQYIERAPVYEGERVDYDLDKFREKAVPIHFFNVVKGRSDDVAGLLFGGLVKELRQRLVPKVEVDLPQLHWESAGLPGKVDLSTPWITGIAKKAIADIVICKTTRHAGRVNWLDLKKYASRSIFVGLEEEWRLFCDAYFPLEFYPVENLLDFAEVVAGVRLFVGNQSFGLALADAMLIPRVAELWESSPNRMPPLNAHRVLTPDIVDTYIGS